MRLQGRVCLVTGASSGIGRAIALRFAQEGANLVLTARRQELLREVAREAQRLSPQSAIAVVPADLRKPEEIERLAEQAYQHFGDVDVVVNNAGIGYFAPATELELDCIEELWQVNVRAPILLTRLVLPRMLQRQQGTLLYVASLAGKYGVKGGSVYAATKFALRGFAESLFQEVRQANIRVVVLCPGSTATAFGGPTASAQKRILQPEDVAEIALAAVLLPVTATLSEVELRPTNP
ncbi:MAG: SDR family NAD(P)-dependent oxidoreductase [Candidatus Kapabacteria bacterium]|nr:SDR family NAD(P)-dependent oxidoreductase [Candidatus Kapabacteria bacterium]MDW8011382.1 SDR family NAD(P)-dependent oxidoreductase [Bacteroidota bacterium]